MKQERKKSRNERKINPPFTNEEVRELMQKCNEENKKSGFKIETGYFSANDKQIEEEF